MQKKILLFGIIVILTGSFFVFQALRKSQSNGLSDQITNSSETNSMPAAQDTTPSASNVSHNVMTEIKMLSEYVTSHPRDTTHILRLARLYQDSHEPAKAVKLYERYVRGNRNSGLQPWLDLTNCYGSLHEWTKALNATKRTLKRFHDNPSALYNRGAIYANLGEYTEAKISWEKVLKLKAPDKVLKLARKSLSEISNGDSTK